MNLDAIQSAVRDAGLDGWLFADFRRSNPVAHAILGLPEQAFFSRRWAYYVPAQGTPTKLASAVESHVLDRLPGEKRVYRTWQQYEEILRELLSGARRVAMEYVPNNAIPYSSRVDAGTVELVRSLGPEVVPSADFAQAFEAVLTPEQIEGHRAAGRALERARERLLPWLRDELEAGTGRPPDAPTLDEYQVQRKLAALMEEEGLHLDEAEMPLIAVNGNAANPHYAPNAERHAPVKRGDVLLIDWSARLPGEYTIFADYTSMVYLGTRDEPRYQRANELFQVIRRARDAGITLLEERFKSGQRIAGYEVDDAVRAVVTDAGYGDAFVHRTGHNIATTVHGNGAHLDNLETHDTRPLLANTITSMEPGIYLPDEDIGVRTEVDVILLPGGQSVEVTGERQQEVQPLFGDSTT
ncbi:MAG TPA: M24 family metallopeptidase [Ktedonobacterales bacterium]